jgi:hypothetical protein
MTRIASHPDVLGTDDRRRAEADEARERADQIDAHADWAHERAEHAPFTLARFVSTPLLEREQATHARGAAQQREGARRLRDLAEDIDGRARAEP